MVVVHASSSVNAIYDNQCDRFFAAFVELNCHKVFSVSSKTNRLLVMPISINMTLTLF